MNAAAPAAYFAGGFFSRILPAFSPFPPHQPGTTPFTIAPTPCFANRSSVARSFADRPMMKSTPQSWMAFTCASVLALPCRQ